MSTQAIVNVLLVEDDPSDVMIIEEILADWQITSTLHVVRDGVEATEYLRRVGAYANAPRPDFVLLDLNMPRKDGFQVLAEIKADLSLNAIPIIILTTANAPDQVKLGYHHRANAYVVKPVDFDDFARVIRQINSFFTQIAQPPPRAAVAPPASD